MFTVLDGVSSRVDVPAGGRPSFQGRRWHPPCFFPLDGPQWAACRTWEGAMLEPPCHSPGDQRLVEGSLFCATGDLGAAATDTPLPVPSSRRVRAKVVPLRGLSLELLVREVPRMPDVIIDVQAPIDSLRLIKSDLEAYFWEYPADAESRRVERFEISFWVRQLADRTAALESILMHKGTAQVVVRGLSVAEAEDLQAAVAVLDQWIREDEPFCDVARKVAAILSATDRIGLRAAGGVARPASP